MTREELKEHCQRQIQQFERVEKIMPVTPNDWKRYEEHKLILELLEQEPILDKVKKAREEIEQLKHKNTDITGYRWWNNAIDNCLHMVDSLIESEEV